MGYKLAGFDVIGCNEIDHRMMYAYCQNNSPKFPFLEPIQTFKDRTDLPPELYSLDILDGSPPCSTFSMAGVNCGREKSWGKIKKFREGQAEQVLDTLFFDFIDLATRRPDMENFKLSTVAKTLGVNVDDELLHNALYDIRLTKAVFDIVTKNIMI